MTLKPVSGRTRFALLLIGTVCVAVAPGCSTPQALLDQANHGATLAMSLQTEMTNFRAVQADVAQHRLDSVRRQLASLASYQIESDFDERLNKLAGTATTTQLYTDLRSLADSRGADEQLLAQQLAQIDADLAAMWLPLPDTAQGLATTQKALAVLGDELSVSDRVKVTSSFARQIKAGIEDNRKKIEAAQANTSPAPVQPPAAAASVPGA